MSAPVRKLGRRQSSGSLGTGTDSAQTSPPSRPPSLPPTPPSASGSLHPDRITLAAPLQPFLPPSSPSTSDNTHRRTPSPATLPSRSRSSSRVFETGTNNEAVLSLGDKQEVKESDEKSPKIQGPIEELLMADMPPLPTPRPPSSCPIFCCFYAEFDNVVGPKVAYQSPKEFMHQDTGVSTEEIHEMLEETFQRVQKDNEWKGSVDMEMPDNPVENPVNDFVVKATSDDDSQEGSLSIFDATSEYIITGNELAGKMINLSTHNMHILTRPTAISDERYERNALLFSVGFVLSRKEDPSPFRPLLCRWADVLRSMEVESHFLTNPKLRVKLQPMLDRLLVSLNSPECECNLLLDSANTLNLHAFRPPTSTAPPVPDHAVPILVREDLLGFYDWDLAIKWISMFISGVDHARWIAIKSDVDMEMVRSCLRVLKHHGVIALVDMFFYSNRYEFTERATAMLAGKEPKLLQEAMEYVSHLHLRSNTNTPPLGEAAPVVAIPGLSSSVGRHSDVPFLPINEDIMSFPPRKGSVSGHHVGSMHSSSKEMSRPHTSRQQQKRMKLALAELYCSCNRYMSFADMMISLVTESSSGSLMIRRGSSRVSTTGGVELDDIQESLGKDRVVRLSSMESDRSSRRMFSPSESSYFDRARKGTEQGAMDWKEVFEFFDHRRFATFGVVHGLLRRVHNYPRAVKARREEEIAFDGQRETLVNGDDQGERLISIRDTSQTSPATTTAFRVASMMDGTKCDDELVSEFEKPLDELLELVESTGRFRVMSTYSSGTERG